MGLSQGRGGWEEVAAGLRAHHSGTEAAELAQQVILLYGGGDGPALLEQLAPERVTVYCVDTDCFRIVARRAPSGPGKESGSTTGMASWGYWAR